MKCPHCGKEMETKMNVTRIDCDAIHKGVEYKYHHSEYLPRVGKPGVPGRQPKTPVIVFIEVK